MKSCAVCNVNFIDGVQCSACNREFDFKCADVSETTWRILTSMREQWKCRDCKSHVTPATIGWQVQPAPTTTANSNSTNVGASGSSTLDDILKEIRDIKFQLAILPELRASIHSIRQELHLLRQTQPVRPHIDGARPRGQRHPDSGKKEKKAEKKPEKKEEKKEMHDELDLMDEKPKESKDPFDSMPKGTFNMDDFKRCYSNEDEAKSIPYFWEKFDPEHYSIWYAEYKYPNELAKVFMSCNLITGMFQRLDKMRKQAFASVCLFGSDNDSSISGVWVWRGQELAFPLSPDWQIDYESYEWKKLDPASEQTKQLVQQYFSWSGADQQGRKFNQGKIFK